MPDNKFFTIEFYTGNVGADSEIGRVSNLFSQLAEGVCPIITIGGMQHEIRELEASANGATYRGVFAKFRADDIPHAGEPGGDERELDLDENEGLIEKNHFIYFRRNELLVYQRNGNANRSSRLSAYLSDVANETVVFNPVLQPDPMRRLMSGDVIPRSIELSVARPTNPEMYPRNNWNNQLIGVLANAGGVRMHVKITSDARSTDENDWYLNERIKRAAREFVGVEGATIIRLNVEEDGIEHPIDLLADRLLSEQVVEMAGRYPVPESMYAALRRAKQEENPRLREIFGDQHNAIA